MGLLGRIPNQNFPYNVFARAFSQNSPYSYNMMNEEEKLSANNPFPPQQAEPLFKFDEEQDTSGKAFEDVADPTKTEDTGGQQDPPVVEDQVEEEQKVPRSRFKKTLEERNSYRERLLEMETKLKELEESRNDNLDASDVPSEWKELYGDSEIALKAYKVQLKLNERREEELIERAKQAIERDMRVQEMQLEENEEIIDDQLAELAETRGVKITSKMEEEILTIVDKYSPVGRDGKYIPGAMFSFEDAFDIYMERNANKVQQTQAARKQVANLQANTAGDDVGSTSSNNYNPGWDSWRKEYGN